MPDFMQSILAVLLLGIVIWLINKPIRRWLKKLIYCKTVNTIVLRILIFAAEHKRAFKPPGSGPQKKEWVMHQYNKWVATADEAVDNAIDFIVAALNSRKATHKNEAKTQLSGVTKDVFDKAFNTTVSVVESTNDGCETGLTDDSDTSSGAVG